MPWNLVSSVSSYVSAPVVVSVSPCAMVPRRYREVVLTSSAPRTRPAASSSLAPALPTPSAAHSAGSHRFHPAAWPPTSWSSPSPRSTSASPPAAASAASRSAEALL